MPAYGAYAPRRPHSLLALKSVHEAVALDGSPGRFALKIFHPPPSTDVRRLYSIEGWLLAAERQRDAAKAGAAVLEVLEFGRCEEGAYMVTPWQDNAFEPLVETVESKGDHLRSFATLLLDALEGWEKQYGAPHGRLRPSNVFLAAPGPLSLARACLSEPWYQPRANPEALRQHDLSTVGAILVQVVRRRQAGGWPIEEAPEWRALGRAGSAWLAYCNYLLNPQPAAGELTLAEARRRLETIPRDARPGRTAALMAASLVFVGVSGTLAFARFGDPQDMTHSLRKLAEAVGNERAFRTEVTPDWARLCRAWNSWLGDIQRNAPRWQRLENFWTPDDPLRKALTEFQASADKLRPQALVSEAAKETRLGVLADSPPDAVRRQLLRGTVADSVSEAWNKVDALAKELEQWKRWEELRGLLTLLEQRGYTRAAAALRPRIPAAPVAPVAPAVPTAPDVPAVQGATPVPPAPAVNGSPGAAAAQSAVPPATDVARLLKLFNDVSLDDAGILLLATQWRQISEVSAELEGSGDRVQKSMPRLILGRLQDRSSLGEFADSLAEPLAELRRRRAQFLEASVVRERFLKESPLQSETGEPVEADLARWEEQLVLFSRVPSTDDPRLSAELDAGVSRMMRGAGDLEPEAPPADGELRPLSRPDFDGAFIPLVERLKGLRAREIIRRDLPAVSGEAATITTSLRQLEQRLEATLVLLKPGVWLRRMAEPVGKSGAVRQRWVDWQQSELRGLTEAALEKDRPRFRQLRQREQILREVLVGIEGPEAFGALSEPALGSVSDDVAAALRTLAATRRDTVMHTALATLEWNGVQPAQPWSAGLPRLRPVLDAHAKWLAGLPEFGNELDRLGALLSSGFGWDDGVGDVMVLLSRREGLDTLAGPVVQLLAEARQLSVLGASEDRAALVAAAKGGGLSRKLTVWRRFGALKGWPSGAEELDLDGGLVSSLRELIGRDVKDDARRDSLLAEITREVRVRWNRAARNASSSEAGMGAVFERMDRNGIGTADLEGPVSYNFTLWQLKRALPGETDLNRLRVQRDAFLQSVRATPVATQPEVGAFLGKLAEVELVDDPKRKPTASPARLRDWREESADSGLTITASWTGPNGKRATLQYQLVQPSDDTLPFYLAQREVSVGEFLDLLAGRPEDAKAVMQAMPPWALSGESMSKPWNKPMAWRPRADYRGLELNPTWIFLPDAQVKGLLENTELRATVPALARAATEVPSARSPLQQVPPDAARLFVEQLLGARLPTPKEWRTLVKLFKPAPGSALLRGRGFQELWRFLETRNEGGQNVRWRPSEGAYLPMVAAGGQRKRLVDDGQVAPDAKDGPLWLAPVDEGPATAGFVHLLGNVAVYLYDDAAKQYYVAGGSLLSPPGIDPAEPQKVETAGLIGARRVTEGFSDVGLRPAFDAPPGMRERFKLLLLVKEQKYLAL